MVDRGAVQECEHFHPHVRPRPLLGEDGDSLIPLFPLLQDVFYPATEFVGNRLNKGIGRWTGFQEIQLGDLLVVRFLA